ncbi:MAG: hypothetical protein K6G71_04440 [Clostridiales bacterium]|nr:hypothetical protein [Clostridiales bacterium]
MLKKTFCLFLKAIVSVTAFSLIFFLIQPFFIPKFIVYNTESTVFVNSFRELPANCVDVLFLGSSQMYSTVDSELLFSEYDIRSWNFGAAAQPVSITPYYLNEALKTQSPKLVAVEVGHIFAENSKITQGELAWNYASMPPSKEKMESLERVLGDKTKACIHAFFPLLVYHDRWRVLNEHSDTDNRYDIDYVLHPDKYNGLYPRGFPRSKAVNKQEYNFKNSDTALKAIPSESKDAVQTIVRVCLERNIGLLFFRSPSPSWTVGESNSVKAFMDKQGLSFMDLNDLYDDLALDENSDFTDVKHLNVFGSEKVTRYLAGILQSYLG